MISLFGGIKYVTDLIWAHAQRTLVVSNLFVIRKEKDSNVVIKEKLAPTAQNVV